MTSQRPRCPRFARRSECSPYQYSSLSNAPPQDPVGTQLPRRDLQTCLRSPLAVFVQCQGRTGERQYLLGQLARQRRGNKPNEYCRMRQAQQKSIQCLRGSSH